MNYCKLLKKLGGRIMAEIEEKLYIEEASTPHDKHLWCLVRWMKRNNYNQYDLVEIIGVGSTVAFAIWKKYSNMRLPKTDPSNRGNQKRRKEIE